MTIIVFYFYSNEVEPVAWPNFEEYKTEDGEYVYPTFEARRVRHLGHEAVEQFLLGLDVELDRLFDRFPDESRDLRAFVMEWSKRTVLLGNDPDEVRVRIYEEVFPGGVADVPVPPAETNRDALTGYIEFVETCGVLIPEWEAYVELCRADAALADLTDRYDLTDVDPNEV